jgi:molecular chaperone DnaK
MSGGFGFVYLLIDCSGSMDGYKMNQAKRGALSFAKDAQQKGYLTGVIRFHTYANVVCEPQNDIHILDYCLQGLKIGRATFMARAIGLAHGELQKRPGSLAMVVVTDGMPNGFFDPWLTLRAAKKAKAAGIEIIAIGTDDANQEFLEKLASAKELGTKVNKNQLAEAIINIAQMLPPPR